MEPEPEPQTEPEPQKEPEPAAEEGVPPADAEGKQPGADGDQTGGTQDPLRKSTKRGSKYSAGSAAKLSGDAQNPVTGGSLPSFTSKPTPVPVTMGGDADGNFRIVMDKKSPTKVSAWQKRWCVFTPEGKLFYYDSEEASHGDLFEASRKDPIDLTQCQRITSNNFSSCHIEFDLGGKKLVQLRVTKESMQLPSGSVINRYDKTKFEQLQEVLAHLEKTGVLPCDATVEKVGDQRVKKERKEMQGRGAVMVVPT